MDFETAWRYLAPKPERGELFFAEIRRAAVTGLKVLGAIEICVPFLTLLAHWATHPAHVVRSNPAQAVLLSLIGVATYAAAEFPWTRRRARQCALVSGWSSAAALIWSTLLMAEGIYGAADYIPAGITVILLTLVAAVPLHPAEVLGLGLVIELTYAGAGFAAEPYAGHHVFILVLTVLATGLSAVLYQRRLSDWHAHQESLQVTEALTSAQFRAQLAENAASVGKFAAALTHEINTPLGVLKSSVETLLALTERAAPASETEAVLRGSIEASMERIREVVGKLQRFVGLADTETRPASLHELLGDVALLYENRFQNGVSLEWSLAPTPIIECRPQLLSLVFSSLLSNAINAVGNKGVIGVSTRLDGTAVEVCIADSGGGMTQDELDHIFDPGFRVLNDRVASANWSLFNIRQIVFEHGGDIRMESAPGQGTRVYVTIPIGQPRP